MEPIVMRGNLLAALEGKKIHVVGASGAEGAALLLYLAGHRGIEGITGHDFSSDFRAFSRSFRKANLAWDKEDREATLRLLRRLPVEFRLGPEYLKGLNDADFVLASQNWFNYSNNLPALPNAIAKGSTLLGLVDIALDLFPGTRLGVTGSNGKSTSAGLISHLMNASMDPQRRFFQGGNDRERQVSLADLEAARKDDVLLWEVSNRHLRDRSVPVDIALLTNITRNHIEDHGSWPKYIAAKLRLPQEALRQGGHAIVCGSDPVTADHLDGLRALGGTLWVVGQAPSDPAEGAAWVDPSGLIKVRPPRQSVALDLGHRDDLPLQGEHNLTNLLAALCACLAAGSQAEDLRGAIQSFSGLSGRLEQVSEAHGVRWIYDIQATTAPAAAAGIQAMAPSANRLLLIVGGEDKGMDYSGMAGAAVHAAAHILALPGSGTDAFLTALGNRCSVRYFDDLDQTIAFAATEAEAGDIVLLSPGCAFFHRSFIEPGKPYARRVAQHTAPGAD
jgi:UDP-N-acetylmuramoylalanine--D-glutamate ligase